MHPAHVLGIVHVALRLGAYTANTLHGAQGLVNDGVYHGILLCTLNNRLQVARRPGAHSQTCCLKPRILAQLRQAASAAHQCHSHIFRH